MGSIEVETQLRQLSGQGNYTEATAFASSLPIELQHHPRVMLERLRVLMRQGQFIEAGNVVSALDLSTATAGDRLLLSLELACLNLFRHATIAESLAQAKELIDQHDHAVEEADLAEAERIYTRVIIMAAVYREVDKPFAQAAHARLPGIARRLEVTGQLDESFAARMTYAQRLPDATSVLKALDRFTRRMVKADRPELAGEAQVVKAEQLLASGQPVRVILSALAKAASNYTMANHQHGLIDVKRVRSLVAVHRELASSDELVACLDAYRSIHYFNGMAKVLMDLSQLAHERGQPDEANSYRQELMRLYDEKGMGLTRDSFQTSQIDLMLRQSDYGAAIELAEAALCWNSPIMLRAGYEVMLTSALSFLKDWSAASNHGRRAVALYEKVDAIDAASDAILKLASDLSSSGLAENWNEAETLLTEWIVKDQERGDFAAVIGKLEMRAQIDLLRYSHDLVRQGDPALLAQATTYLDEAETHVQHLSEREALNRSGSLHQLRAQVLQHSANWQQVIEEWQKAYGVYRTAGNSMNAANCQYLLGVLYLNLANQELLPNFELAESHLHQALTYYETASARSQAGDTHFMLARLYVNASLRVNQPIYNQLVDAAIAHLAISETLYDAIRREFGAGATAVAVQQGKLALIQTSRKIYELAIEILCLHRPEPIQAWQWVQRAKARGLTDMLGIDFHVPERLLSDLAAFPESFELISHERTLTQRLSRASPANKATLRQELHLLWAKMSQDKHLTDYMELRLGSALTLEDMQSLLKNTLDGGQNAVCVDWLAIGDQLFLMTLKVNEAPQLTRLSIRLSTVQQFIAANLSSETFRITLRDIPELLSELEPLVEPLSWLTSADDVLILAPTQLLFALPLHALELKQEPLLLRNPVVYIPSLSTLRHCLSSGGLRMSMTTAIIGDPRQNLSEAAKLVASLSQQFSETPLIGSAVTRSSFVSKISKANIIHFQGHAVHVPDAPLLSYLELADSHFTAQDVFGLDNLQATLITLAACESASNVIAPGDEPLGLIPAFLYAKARSVVATLWKVQQHSAAHIMHYFYNQLTDETNAIGKAQALRNAMLRVRAMPGFESPYHWAPFVIYGDWDKL